MYKAIETNCIKLAKSLIFKINILPITINKTLEEYGYTIPLDKKQWKYYLNISGSKHFTNSDVKITILEDGNEYSLSKELLETFTYSKSVLMEDSSYYRELTSKYPKDVEYILGCIYPIDIDKAIEADEGVILSYNKNLIEYNEINIITEIEKYIKKVLYRWKIDKFTEFENLYAHTLLTIIYLNLPSVILNLRLKNINTPYVNNYFMDVYFKSNGLTDEVNYLNRKSRFWLYRNLDYIRHNIGKNDTLQKIIDNLFTENNIGIAKVDILKKIGFDKDNLPYKEIVVNPNPYNPNYNKDTNVNIPDEMMKDVDTITRDEDSKVVHISMKDNYTFYPGKVEAIVNNWAYMLKHNIFNVHKNFTDPNIGITSSNGMKIGTIKDYVDPITSITYKLNSYTAFLVLLKLLLHLDKKEDLKLNKIYFNGILNKEYNIDNLELYDDGYSKDIINNLHNKMPDIPTVINREDEFKSYMDKYFDFKTDVWTYMANVQNSSITGNIKLYGNMVEIEDNMVITTEDKTIDEILADFEIDYILGNGYDLILSIKALISVFTTFIDDSEFYQKEAEQYKILLSKLTSYTIHPINQTAKDTSINFYDNMPTIFNTKNPLSTILDMSATPLEDIELILDSYLDDYVNIVSSYINKTMVKVCGYRDISGGMGIYSNLNVIRNIPINMVTVLDTCYDISDEEWKDEFIHGVKLSAIPLEDEVVIDSEIEHYNVITNISKNRTNNNITSMEYITGSYGNIVKTDIVNKPVNIINVLDENAYDILDEDFTDTIFTIKPNDVKINTSFVQRTKTKMIFTIDDIVI